MTAFEEGFIAGYLLHNKSPAVPVIESLTVTANGTYTAPDGTDGYSPVNVKVPDKYDKGYSDGFSKAMDIISGHAPDEDVEGGGGTYSFEGGAVPGLNENQVGQIAKSLVAATGTAYITDTVHGKTIKYGTVYRSESDDWLLLLELYDSKTGNRIDSSSGSWNDSRGGGTDDIRISDISIFRGYYMGVAVNWHKYNAPPGYSTDASHNVSWINDNVTPSFVVSGSAPAFSA